MIYLIFMAAVVAFLGYAPPKYHLQQNNYEKYIWICGVLIAAVAALRTPYTGTGDNITYYYCYKNLQNFETFQEYYDVYLSDYDLLSSEAGFFYTFWLFGHVFKDGQMAIVISSLLVTVSVCVFIRRNAVDVSLSLTIYVCLGLFTFNMNGMRQAMAMAICLFAYDFAKNRKLIPFVLTVLLAMLFHKTAMCFFPVYFLPRLKNTFGSWLFYIFGLIMCLLFLDRLMAGYSDITGKDYTDNEAATGGGIFVILLYVGSIMMAMYKSGILERQAGRTAMLATLTGFTAYIARFVGSSILERVSYYYFYFPILLIPETFQELDEREYKLVKMIFVLGCMLLFVYRITKGAFRNFTFYFM